MIRTRVGYAGGKKELPTYRAIGDHTETLEVDFDPKVTSYGAMLDLFFASHNPCADPWSRQYMSAIFAHGDEQLRLAREKAVAAARQRGGELKTRIEPAGRFYLAEDYHQKYRLRSCQGIVEELVATYPDLVDFVNSTVATRLNGYAAGYGSKEQFERELPKFGLSDAATRKAQGFGSRLR